MKQEPDLAKHGASFLAAKKYFQSIGLTIDKATKDATRLMFVSDDPELWLNPVLPPILPPLENPEDSGPEAEPAQEKKGKSGRPICVEEVREMLSVIPPHPSYDDWIRIAWSVFSVTTLEQGCELLEEWSPEDTPGGYEKLFRQRSAGKKVGIGTLRHYARKNGYIPAITIPEDVLPLPAGGVGNHRAATVIFTHLATTKSLFVRGDAVCEVIERPGGAIWISAVCPERFVELVETVGKRVAERQDVTNGDNEETKSHKTVWRTKTMPLLVAKVLLCSRAARTLLPPLRQIVNSPLVVETKEGGCEILTKGYHSFSGGTYVTTDLNLEKIPGDLSTIASSVLKNLLLDFDFATPADLSRAVASFISPALKMGGLIAGDFPLDVAEADQSQSGKTFRQQMVAALYGETPTVITSRKGGVGSLDESVATALLRGKPFITIDNLRGRIDSQLLETALRGHGYADCRGFRASENVDVSPFIWQLSTNGAEFTRDLSNRAVITRIRKRPAGYRYMEYREGSVLAHLRARRGFYLSAVFTIIRKWVVLGKPQTSESRHDFREWIRPLDWILQNLMGLPPLMDGHLEEQSRTSNPRVQSLRDVILAAGPQAYGRSLSTTEIVAIADNAGVDFPGGNPQKPILRAGQILSNLFKQACTDELRIDGFVVKQLKIPGCDEHGPRTQSRYIFREAERKQ